MWRCECGGNQRLRVCGCVLVSFISCPHTGTKCTSRLFSCVQGSISRSPKPRKLQRSQAENRSGIWTTASTCLKPPAHEAIPTVNEESVRVMLSEGSVDLYVCDMTENRVYIAFLHFLVPLSHMLLFIPLQ